MRWLVVLVAVVAALWPSSARGLGHGTSPSFTSASQSDLSAHFGSATTASAEGRALSALQAQGLVAGEKLLAGRGRALGGDYTLINSLLGEIEFEIPFDLEPVTIPLLFSSVTIVFDDSALCNGFQVSDIPVSGALNGLSGDDEVYALDASIEDFEFFCELGVSANGNTDGRVTLSSTSSSGTRFAVASDFSDFSETGVATTAEPRGLTCDEAVDVSGVQIDAENLISVFGIPLTPLLVAIIQNDIESFTGPVQEVGCEVLANATVAINAALLSALVSTDTDVSLLAAEQALDVPDDVNLLDLQALLGPLLGIGLNVSDLIGLPDGGGGGGGGGDGGIGDQLAALLDGFAFADLNVTDILSSLGLNVSVGDLLDLELVEEDLSELVNATLGPEAAALLGALGLNFTAINDFLDDVVQGDLSSLDGVASLFDENSLLDGSVDLVPLARLLLPSNFSLDVSLNVSALGINTVDAELTSLFLTFGGAGPAAQAAADASGLEFVGPQTLALPATVIGNFSLNGTVALTFDTDVSVVQDELALAFAWSDVGARFALLLAVDDAALGTVQLGPFTSDPLSCLLSAFFVPPQLAGVALTSSSLTLGLSGASDGLTSLFQDSFNALVQLFEASFPLIVAGAVADATTGVALLEAGVCDPYPRTQEALDTPFDFEIDSDSDSDSGSGALDSLLALVLPLLPAQVALVDQERPLALVDDLGLTVTLQKATLLRLGANWTESVSLLAADAADPQLFATTVSVAAFALELELRTGAPGSAGEAALLLTLSAAGAEVGVGALARLSEYAVLSMPLADVLSLDCWVARLGPFGGLKSAALEVDDVQLAAGCPVTPAAALLCEADGALLAEVAARLASEGGREELQAVVDGALAVMENAVVAPFEEDRWQVTVDGSALACQGLGPGLLDGLLGGGGGGDGDVVAGAGIDSDATGAFAYIGALGAVVLGAGLFTCGANGTFAGRRRRNVSLDHGSAVATVAVLEEERPGETHASADAVAGVSAAATATAATATATATACGGAGSMRGHPDVGLRMRVLVEAGVLLSLVLFVLGHSGKVVDIDIEGTVLGNDVAQAGFSGFSVFTSVQELAQGGAYAIAFFVGAFSLAWPYVKLIGMSLCWALPASRLGEERRGAAIAAMDVLGKWSFLEVYFVSAVLVLLEVRVAAPETDLLFLGLYDVTVVVKEGPSLVTLVLALVLSLALSGSMLWRHELTHDNRLLAKVLQASGGDVSGGDVSGGEDGGGALLANPVASLAVAAVAAVSAGLIAGSVAVATLDITLRGLVPVLAEAGGEPTEFDVALADIISGSFGGGTFQAVLAGFVVVGTVVVVPAAHQCGLAWAALQRDLPLARVLWLRRVNNLMAAWSCIEVFIFAIALTVLEVETVSVTLLEAECEPILPLVDALQLVGLISEEDTLAGCYLASASVVSGAFVFIAAIVGSNVSYYVVSRALDRRIAAADTHNVRKSVTNPAFAIPVAKTEP